MQAADRPPSRGEARTIGGSQDGSCLAPTPVVCAASRRPPNRSQTGLPPELLLSCSSFAGSITCN